MQLDLSPLDRHAKIALSFSGGKDSLAVVYLLRSRLDDITIYHMDTGDLLPEITTVVDHVCAFAPHFVTVRGDIHAALARDGLPTDLLPHSAHPIGQLMAEGPKLVGRYDCCWRNLMEPLYRRIVADGNTLLIRGTKQADMNRLPAASGQIIDGLELFYPLQDWTHAQVFAYLREAEAPIARVYRYMTNAPECARCSAWWGEQRNAYLRRYHPRLWLDYRRRIETVADAIDAPLANLRRETAMQIDAVAPPPGVLAAATTRVWEMGYRVLQGHRLADTEREHVAQLLALMAPPKGATVLDVGAGFGEVARLMQLERPDLHFILLNNSRKQLTLASKGSGLTGLYGDMHKIPLADRMVDGVMFCYSLCHADPFLALAEARRVTKLGGFCFVYDYERLAGDNTLLERHLYARAYPQDDLLALFRAAGWDLMDGCLPGGSDQVFRAAFGDDALYDTIFRDLRPAIWRLETTI